MKKPTQYRFTKALWNSWIFFIKPMSSTLCMLLMLHAIGVTQPIFKGPIQNLGHLVNDAFSQVNPVFSTDGSTLFFSQGSGPNQQPEVWKTISDSLGRIIGKEKIKALNPNINQPKYLLQSLTSHQFLVSGNYNKYQKEWIYGRGISVYQEGSSTDDFTPEAIEKKSIPTLDSIFKRNTIYPFYHPFLNLYLWSQTDGNQSDIYLLLPQGNNPPNSIKLPANINTAFNEITPWLEDEGRYLYFASNRPGGLGETDIYVSERLDGSYKKWSTPKNLGSLVNSNKNESHFIIDPFGSYAYVVSEKNSYGKTDIFRIGLQQQNDSQGYTGLLLPGDKPDTSIQFRDGEHAPNNIVFLLDVSQSMAQSRKMVLLKKSMYKLVQQLRPTDKMSMVIFGSGVETLLNGQSVRKKDIIIDAIQMLRANGGSTNISAGLQRAYEQAESQYLPHTNNQLFVITDGVFKLKTTDEQLASSHKNIQLTAVVVGNDAQTSAAFSPLVKQANGQLLHIGNEATDVNLLLQNVRAHAAVKQ